MRAREIAQELCKRSQMHSVVLAVVLEDCDVSFLLVSSDKKSLLSQPRQCLMAYI